MHLVGLPDRDDLRRPFGQGLAVRPAHEHLDLAGRRAFHPQPGPRTDALPGRAGGLSERLDDLLLEVLRGLGEREPADRLPRPSPGALRLDPARRARSALPTRTRVAARARAAGPAPLLGPLVDPLGA